MARLQIFPLLVLGFISAVPTSTHANEGDVINMNASVYAFHDDNLFRLAPGVSIPTSRSDTMLNTGVGINFDKRMSMQRLVANINLSDRRYQQHDYLNFVALNYDANWLWAAGLRWNGYLFLDRNQSLLSFADNRNVTQRNVRVIENQRFDLNYWFHSSWYAVGGVSHTTLQNEQVFLEDSDYDALGYNVGLRYKPRSGNTMTWRLKHYEATYQKRQFNAFSQFDNAFNENSSELAVRWQLSGKSALNGNLEYISRKHEHFSSRDYSGWIGNLDYAYGFTGNASATLGYRHSLNTYQQFISSYYVSDELNLAAQWASSSKVISTARVGYAERKYQGEIVPLPGIPQRHDKVGRVGFDVAFKPARWAELKAGAVLEKRFSNYNQLDYVDRNVFLSMTATL